jgi:hypothetical protein
VPGISHLKNRTKKLGKDSFDALRGRMHSIVYMDTEGNILWDKKVNYNSGVLAVPSPMTLAQWQERCKSVKL